MCWWWGLAALACLDAALVVSGGNAILSAGKPGGRQGGGAGYTKQHSKIAYRLASDRREDRHGPAPSYSDYHVPTALKGGVGLSRVMLVAESRCHFGSFNLTTCDPDGRASLAQSLNDLPCANQPIAPSQCRFASKIMQLPSIFFRAPHRPPPAQSLRRFRCASSSASTDGLETFMSYARLQSKERASQRH